MGCEEQALWHFINFCDPSLHDFSTWRYNEIYTKWTREDKSLEDKWEKENLYSGIRSPLQQRKKVRKNLWKMKILKNFLILKRKRPAKGVWAGLLPALLQQPFACWFMMLIKLHHVVIILAAMRNNPLKELNSESLHVDTKILCFWLMFMSQWVFRLDLEEFHCLMCLRSSRTSKFSIASANELNRRLERAKQGRQVSPPPPNPDTDFPTVAQTIPFTTCQIVIMILSNGQGCYEH